MAQKRGPRAMSVEHKAALAEKRQQGRAIRRYLEALEAYKPKRGRKRTPESIKKRVQRIEQELTADPEPLKRLQLVQERLDLERELTALEERIDVDALEKEFVSSAKSYSARKGISYAAWRELGVPPTVLRKAGLTRRD